MYPIYFEQQPTHQSLTLNDYIQLQALLRQEQIEREQHRLLQEYQKQQEQRRIQKALYKLQVMTELYRQREQEELAIQAYYAAKKKQQEEQRRRQLIEQQEQQRRLLIQRQQEQQQREYFAALQERQALEDEYHRLALALQRQQLQQQKSTHYAHPGQALAAACCSNNATVEQEESESESEAEEDEETHQAQLATLVKLIFGAQDHHETEEKQAEAEKQEETEQEAEVEQQEQGEEHQESQDQHEHTMTLDQFVDYISKKAQSLDDQDSVGEEDQNQGSASNNEDNMEEDDTALLAIEHIDDDESMDEEEDDFEHVDKEDDEDLAALAIEHIDEEEEKEDVPALVESNNGIQELVNDILTTTASDNEDDFTQFPTEDPVKIAKYDALSRIEQELNEIRQKHEDHVLHVALDFSDALNNSERAASPEDTLVTATTAANREFLGYEDQIMKTLLKLDMIESDGDEDIRNERKALVKLAEEMLDKLDEFKQKEWERVSCSSHSEDEDM